MLFLKSAVKFQSVQNIVCSKTIEFRMSKERENREINMGSAAGGQKAAAPRFWRKVFNIIPPPDFGEFCSEISNSIINF